jgi:hydroxyethylthiazole kinase-like sugar kinase family protein
MAAVRAPKASMGTAVITGCGAVSGAVVATAVVVMAGAVVKTGGAAVVVAAVGMTAAEEDEPGPDMADTRLLDLGIGGRMSVRAKAWV